MKKSITPTDEQYGAIKAIKKWFVDFNTPNKRNKKIRFVLGGLAGSGKSSIIPHILSELGLDMSQVHFCAYTGKASLVLQQKGLLNATTIHKLIYIPKVGKNGKVYFVKNSEIPNFQLIIVDEASLVSRKIQYDLESFGIPILYVGDYGQLPPVSNDMSNLMLDLDFRLETIHRQALDNPIIWVANQVRLGKWLKYGKYGETVLKTSKSKLNTEILLRTSQVLCGKNATRQRLNSEMRAYLGFNSQYPQINDKMICLKNSNDLGLVNGMLGVCTAFNESEMRMSFKNDEDYEWKLLDIDEEIFISGKSSEYKRDIEQFDFGRAITVHKFQGSQDTNVLLYEEQLTDRTTHCKWLYTGCTRAIEKLIIAS